MITYILQDYVCKPEITSLFPNAKYPTMTNQKNPAIIT